MAKKSIEKKETKATAKPAEKKARVVEAPAKAPKAAKPKAPAFDAEKFESTHLPSLAALARTRGEDQEHEGVTVHQDGTYTVGE